MGESWILICIVLSDCSRRSAERDQSLLKTKIDSINFVSNEYVAITACNLEMLYFWYFHELIWLTHRNFYGLISCDVDKSYETAQWSNVVSLRKDIYLRKREMISSLWKVKLTLVTSRPQKSSLRKRTSTSFDHFFTNASPVQQA